jgi:hypothetical protein
LGEVPSSVSKTRKYVSQFAPPHVLNVKVPGSVTRKGSRSSPAALPTTLGLPEVSPLTAPPHASVGGVGNLVKCE